MFEIILKKENHSITRKIDLKNEKKAIDEIYKMAYQLDNKLYAEQCKIDQRELY